MLHSSRQAAKKWVIRSGRIIKHRITQTLRPRKSLLNSLSARTRSFDFNNLHFNWRVAWKPTHADCRTGMLPNRLAENFDHKIRESIDYRRLTAEAHAPVSLK